MKTSPFTRIFAVAALLAAAIAGIARTGEPAENFATTDISDLALIYQGSRHRIDWNKEEIEPYVTHRFADGTEDWLFDGFLFLDFKDGSGYAYTPLMDSLAARKEHWEWYLDRVFERGKGLDALDKCIGEKKKTLGEPPFRHKVVLTVPVPFPGQTDWGELDGRALDFNNIADRKAAVIWFIDRLTDGFAAQEYQNIDIDGIYFLAEDIATTKDFPREIAEHIHSRGLKFVWIPYFMAEGHRRWRELGFDIAYHQPNHFFEAHIPDSRLDDAIDEALRYGMAIEFECDERALESSADGFAPRMDAYIDAFERHGVFERSAIAYYTGNHLFLDFSRERTPANVRLADRLARHIVNRHKK